MSPALALHSDLAHHGCLGAELLAALPTREVSARLPCRSAAGNSHKWLVSHGISGLSSLNYSMGLFVFTEVLEIVSLSFSPPRLKFKNVYL